MNLKKIAASIAALGAVTFAHAANVEFYGSIDNSVSYIKAKGQNGQASMYASNDSSPKLGLTGKEDIGNGHFVRFKLENGFESGTGALKTDSKLFDRESTLFIKGGFGTVYAGRMGTLVSDAGSVGFYGSMASALATGWSDNIAGHNAVMANYSSRYDNTIAYVSPEFAGVTIYAQYAMGDTNENKASNDRYAALGAE